LWDLSVAAVAVGRFAAFNALEEALHSQLSCAYLRHRGPLCAQLSHLQYRYPGQQTGLKRVAIVV
jgi:hypothetical protein